MYKRWTMLLYLSRLIHSLRQLVQIQQQRNRRGDNLGLAPQKKNGSDLRVLGDVWQKPGAGFQKLISQLSDELV